MKISELFVKKIDRPINGVIKADQRDLESIWQELDEYVITNQLTDYFRRFFDAYLAGLDRPNDPVIAARMGVWVSGFFGSGKSHFIKILSYLLENIEAINKDTGEHKRAVNFFDEIKVKDAMLRADIQRAALTSTDVILFNIDAKADSKTDRDVILQVFLRVLNERLGYSGDAPHIAHMERHLVSKGVYDSFKAAFEASNGASWLAERDAVEFLRDDVVVALSKALSISEDAAGSWFDSSRDNYRINIIGFAQLVKDYLDTKPAKHRIIFLVDEVGQFIGDNTQLMLNLQTITEQLGTLCDGRAWIVVTSQEDIDAAIGEANKAKTQDFSKIQGRFHTRLSLASSNTDEVIGKRLLAKTEAAHVQLRDVFIAKGDIINNQLAFSGDGVTLRGYKDAADYVNNYPFAPYQFTLLSKIFEAIRRNGATGKHLSKGERSLLDAFQTAAKDLIDKDTNVLVPLNEFYPSIEGFLDSTVRHAIDKAVQEIGGIFETFDIQLLKTLFLIRYIPEIVKGNVDNLATLCVNEIDCDKLSLKRQIQESLARLEKQSLVNRNGEDWMFLTNEEQDIAREIAHETVSYDELTRKLADLVFEQVWKGQTKVRHRDSKGDYEFNRMLDGKPYKSANNDLSLEIITELHDEFSLFNDAKCRLYSATAQGRAIVVLEQGERLYDELQTLIKVDNYIVSKYENVSQSAKKVLGFKKDENREREARLRLQLDTLIGSARCFALGEPIAIRAQAAGTVLDDAINYLVTNTYNKLTYLNSQPNAFDEIRAVLQADNVAQQTMLTGGDVPNALALGEVREFLKLKASNNHVLLDDVVKHFSGIPYGWKPDWDIVLLVARLFMGGELKLMMDSSDLDPKQAVEPLTKAIRFKQVGIIKRKSTGAAELKKARDLYKDLFHGLAKDDEDSVVADFRMQLVDWDKQLTGFLPLARQEFYPGAAEIIDLQAKIKKQTAIRDTFAFIEELIKSISEWQDAEENLHDLAGFYHPEKGQILTWRKLLAGLVNVNANRDKLLENQKAAAALHDLETIRDNPRPYGQINRIEALLASLENMNAQLASERRQIALTKLDAKLAAVQAELSNVHADADLSNQALRHLQALKQKIETESSIATIFYLQDQSMALLDEAIDLISHVQKKAIQAAASATASATAVATTVSSAVFTGNGGPAPSHIAQPTPAQAKPAVAISAALVKPTRPVRAASFVGGKLYLESANDVDEYVSNLREELMKVINAGQRARIE